MISKKVLTKVLTGYFLDSEDIKVMRLEMDFLNDNNLIAFVNKLNEYYQKSTSFATMLTPFVNIIARVDKYETQYQQLSVIAKESIKIYSDERDENTLHPEDKGKIFDFDPESVKYHIDEFLKTDRDKALAAVYALQPPRRLDFKYMIVTEDHESILTNPNYNYLVVVGGVPSRFV